MAAAPVIDIRGLTVGFRGRQGSMRPVLRDVDLQVCPGESVGIVGESGSGKSTLALAAMGFLKPGLVRMAGEVRFGGRDMFALTGPELAAVRGGKLGLIPQNSGQALTPTMRVGRQLAEALRLHCDLPETDRAARITALLSQVRLPDPDAIARRYPHELSGGQQQRVAVAMALAGEPEALLLDEPTTGLDVTTQAHILELLRDLAAEHDMAMVYVSHDLGVIARVCTRVHVMYAGQSVLEGPVRDVLGAPVHPYARGLLGSIPRLCDACLPVALGGRPPMPGDPGPGCAFAPRCALADARCRAEAPALEPVAGQIRVRCFHHDRAGEIAAKPVAPRAAHPAGADTALLLEDVAISYHRPGFLARLTGAPAPVPTVAGISMRIARGETIGLVGESGSGKSTILKCIAGLLPPAAGRITAGAGAPLPPAVEARTREQLRCVQMVFQNPDESLNPRQSVATILAQPLALYFGLGGKALVARSAELLETVRLGPEYLQRMPGQLSGGEKQRVAVARAFAAEPEVVLCDEVTSALDVSVQAAVLDLLDSLRRARETTYIFVSHDLAVVRALADRVAVLYQGRLCELGPVARVYAAPSHPYTEVLLNAVLEPDPDTAPRLMAADVVELSPPARGCPFQRRCPRKLGAVCETEAPPWRDMGAGHTIRCHIPPADLGDA